jgi:inosine-uridine nucleoside N-ribohydrolase
MSRVSKIVVWSFFAWAASLRAEPVKLIFDTDIGNDVDDAMALSVIHELADRGEVEFLAATISKDNPWAAPYVDLVNTFYGRPDVPIGQIRNGKTPEDGKFNRQVAEAKNEKGEPLYPHDLKSGDDAPEAVGLLRKTLAAQPDGSVVIVSVGFLTNLARLLDSKPDEHSPDSGMDLVKKKIKLYVTMAGAFSPKRVPEYNALIDAEATRAVFERWPTPIVASGFEIGIAVPYPHESIEKDFSYVTHHPVAEAYRLYEKMPHDRPTWDLTAVLYAVRPEHRYFTLSYPGRITLNEKNVTEFAESASGTHRYFILDHEQAVRVRETLVQLVSSPPGD